MQVPIGHPGMMAGKLAPNHAILTEQAGIWQVCRAVKNAVSGHMHVRKAPPMAAVLLGAVGPLYASLARVRFTVTLGGLVERSLQRCKQLSTGLDSASSQASQSLKTESKWARM